jgi:hypothetical protein
MEAFLKSQMLWGIISGDNAYPIDSTIANTITGDPIPEPSQKLIWACATWQAKNDAALSTILLHVTPTLADTIHGKTAKAAWKHLQTACSFSYTHQQFIHASNFQLEQSHHPFS